MTNIVRDSDVVELNGPPAFRYGERVRAKRLVRKRLAAAYGVASPEAKRACRAAVAARTRVTQQYSNR